MKIVKFALVGATNTIFCYLLYVILIQWGLNFNIALALDYAVGVVTGYLLNRFWTFASHGRPQWGFGKYVLTYVGVFFTNAALLNLIVELHLAGPVIGQFIALIIVTMGSFLLQKHWVFKPIHNS